MIPSTDKPAWREATGRHKLPRRSFTPQPPEPGLFTDPDLIVPQLFCWVCRWHVCQPNMPTYRYGLALVCVFCAYLVRDRGRLRPLHEVYAGWVEGSGAPLDEVERAGVLLRLGARPRTELADDEESAA